MWKYCSIVFVWWNWMASIWEKMSLLLASSCSRRKYRAVVEATPSFWVVHFVKFSLHICCVGSRVNPVIWLFGDLDLIWFHSVPNINQHRFHPPLIILLYPVISKQNTWPLLFDFPPCIVKVSCIVPIVIQIPTISPLIKFILLINVQYGIILTLEVHQVSWKCLSFILPISIFPEMVWEHNRRGILQEIPGEEFDNKMVLLGNSLGMVDHQGVIGGLMGDSPRMGNNKEVIGDLPGNSLGMGNNWGTIRESLVITQKYIYGHGE